MVLFVYTWKRWQPPFLGCAAGDGVHGGRLWRIFSRERKNCLVPVLEGSYCVQAAGQYLRNVGANSEGRTGQSCQMHALSADDWMLVSPQIHTLNPNSQSPKALQMVTAAIKLEDTHFSEGKTWRLFCCHSVTQASPTLCDSMDCSTPGFPVLH